MDIISLLITIAGIIIILALYLLGQVSRNKMPKENDIGAIPNIEDENGNQFTSVLDDIPATDGSTPKPIPQRATEEQTTAAKKPNDPDKSNRPKKDEKSASTTKKQNILFISAKDDKGLDGNQIDTVFTDSGLSYGDMDIYHFTLKGNSGKQVGLFRVANGVEPWTLRPEDLKNKSLPGLSLLLMTPSPIDDKKAIKTFINTAKTISKKLNGELKNQQQQVFTQKDEDELLNQV